MLDQALQVYRYRCRCRYGYIIYIQRYALVIQALQNGDRRIYRRGFT